MFSFEISNDRINTKYRLRQQTLLHAHKWNSSFTTTRACMFSRRFRCTRVVYVMGTTMLKCNQTMNSIYDLRTRCKLIHNIIFTRHLLFLFRGYFGLLSTCATFRLALPFFDNNIFRFKRLSLQFSRQCGYISDETWMTPSTPLLSKFPDAFKSPEI